MGVIFLIHEILIAELYSFSPPSKLTLITVSAQILQCYARNSAQNKQNLQTARLKLWLYIPVCNNILIIIPSYYEAEFIIVYQSVTILLQAGTLRG